MKLIDRDALVAEINRIVDVLERNSGYGIFCEYQMVICEKILSFLDTLEVKEVDLKKEIETHLKDCLDVKFPTTDIELIKKDVTYTAEKFFELGLKAQKGE